MSTDNKDAVLDLAAAAYGKEYTKAFSHNDGFFMMFESGYRIAHAAQAERIKQLEHEIWCAGVNADGAREKLGEVRVAALEEAALLCWNPGPGYRSAFDRGLGAYAEGCEATSKHNSEAIRTLKSKPVQQPGDVRDLSARDATSVSDMCALLDKHFIKRSEYTDCTILYSVTFEQLRNLYDEGRAIRSHPTQKGQAQ